jgi:hypothetical protein
MYFRGEVLHILRQTDLTQSTLWPYLVFTLNLLLRHFLFHYELSLSDFAQSVIHVGRLHLLIYFYLKHLFGLCTAIENFVDFLCLFTYPVTLLIL